MGSSAFLGREQVEWLIAGLKASTATWKVISADMPIGLNVGDGKNAQGEALWEALANGNDGVPLGRELEMARLLSSIKAVPNVVWITTDVHYCAARYYDPAQARFTNFSPFWEFVAGPMNAGTFGPGVLDKTFGPTAVFSKSPLIQNRIARTLELMLVYRAFDDGHRQRLGERYNPTDSTPCGRNACAAARELDPQRYVRAADLRSSTEV